VIWFSSEFKVWRLKNILKKYLIKFMKILWITTLSQPYLTMIYRRLLINIYQN